MKIFGCFDKVGQEGEDDIGFFREFEEQWKLVENFSFFFFAAR